jgi:hypothetical protein
MISCPATPQHRPLVQNVEQENVRGGFLALHEKLLMTIQPRQLETRSLNNTAQNQLRGRDSSRV